VSIHSLGMAELEINGPDWAREHIYRRHKRPAFRCPRCLDTFETDDKLNEHARSDAICDTKDAPPEEETIYISKSQESQLRKKKRERSEEERWFNIFNMLFPGVPVDQRPSPCKQILQKWPCALYHPSICAVSGLSQDVSYGLKGVSRSSYCG